MDLAFDHLIHYVTNPNEVEEALAPLALMNHQGGKHESTGTFNTLTHFGLSYIEYLGISDQKTYKDARPTLSAYSPIADISNQQEREGFLRIALRSHHLEEVAAHLRNKGVDVEGPSPLSRRTPEGELLSWELLHAGSEMSELALPFFIDWKKKR